MTFRSARSFAAVLGAALAGCGGQAGPPRHPIAEMTSRATAKLDVLDLVVSDPERADRLRAIYLRAFQLGRDFDVARAHSLAHARRQAEPRNGEPADQGPDTSPFESVLAPPAEVGRGAMNRYVALMLEARKLLTQEEFEKLDALR